MSLAAMGALSAAASLVAAASSVSQGRAIASAEDASAQQAQIEADLASSRASREAGVSLRQGLEQAESIRKSGKRLASEQQAAFGGAGVTLEGSPMLVLSETIAEAETDAIRALRGSREAGGRILEQGEDISRSRQFQAKQHKFAGKQAKKAGVIGATSSLLTGGLRTVGVFTPSPGAVTTAPTTAGLKLGRP